jgi:dolichyl-diphosphooligosaccharide--protein glycosyltransferase
VVLYALSAVYFAGVMVRLMLTLTPAVCVLSGIAFSRLLELYLREEENPQTADTDSEEEGGPERNSRNMYDKVQGFHVRSVSGSPTDNVVFASE